MTSNINTSLYKQGLLRTLLEHIDDFPEIASYLHSEEKYLQELIEDNDDVIDFGCGYGRHLKKIESKIRSGYGIDISEEYIKVAKEKNNSKKNSFSVGDIHTIKTKKKFTKALCMYNTFGNISEKKNALNNMKKALVSNGRMIVSVFSEKSIDVRIAMYESMNLTNPRVVEDRIITNQGFWSCHFSEKSILNLFPDAELINCSDIGWIISTEVT